VRANLSKIEHSSPQNSSKVVHHYPTAGVRLDLGRRFGSGCIFGRLNRQEPEWCAQALEFGEATL
jgi:hypothetical protein